MNLLIVEDDAQILNFLKSSFKSEGFVVDFADDGAVGLAKVRQNEYDLIILDLGLPNKSGKEICREVRSMGKSVPIIMLSIMGEVENKIELLHTGADDYVVKPFSFSELLARAKAILRRPQYILRDVLHSSEIKLDTKGRKVFCCGKEIHVTPKEFALLEYLIRNKGRALSRADILEHVWDVNADPCTNTIETHIVSLRKKLKTKGDKDVIYTIPSFGYRMD